MTTIPAFWAGLLLVAFLYLERRTRAGENARSLVAGPDDRGTTKRLANAYATAILTFMVATIVGLFGYFWFPWTPWAWLGVLLILAGIGVRFWSAGVLGESYTRTLRTSEGQRIVRAGPYRYVRHPGYAGSVLMWMGVALATGDWLGVLVIIPVIGLAYMRRIEAEDRMLMARFGSEYATYAREVRRLVPYVY